MFVKISKNITVDTDNVSYCTDYSSRKVSALVKQKREENKCLNLAGNKKISSVLVMKDGWVILTNVTFDTTFSRLKGD